MLPSFFGLALLATHSAAQSHTATRLLSSLPLSSLVRSSSCSLRPSFSHLLSFSLAALVRCEALSCRYNCQFRLHIASTAVVFFSPSRFQQLRMRRDISIRRMARAQRPTTQPPTTRHTRHTRRHHPTATHYTDNQQQQPSSLRDKKKEQQQPAGRARRDTAETKRHLVLFAGSTGSGCGSAAVDVQALYCSNRPQTASIRSVDDVK